MRNWVARVLRLITLLVPRQSRRVHSCCWRTDHGRTTTAHPARRTPAGPKTARILRKTGRIDAYIAPEPPRRGPRLRRSHKLSHIQGQCNAPFCTLYTRARAALSSALLEAGTGQSSTIVHRHRRLGGHCGAGSACRRADRDYQKIGGKRCVLTQHSEKRHAGGKFRVDRLRGGHWCECARGRRRAR